MQPMDCYKNFIETGEILHDESGWFLGMCLILKDKSPICYFKKLGDLKINLK